MQLKIFFQEEKFQELRGWPEPPISKLQFIIFPHPAMQVSLMHSSCLPSDCLPCSLLFHV